MVERQTGARFKRLSVQRCRGRTVYLCRGVLRRQYGGMPLHSMRRIRLVRGEFKEGVRAVTLGCPCQCASIPPHLQWLAMSVEAWRHTKWVWSSRGTLSVGKCRIFLRRKLRCTPSRHTTPPHASPGVLVAPLLNDGGPPRLMRPSTGRRVPGAAQWMGEKA